MILWDLYQGLFEHVGTPQQTCWLRKHIPHSNCHAAMELGKTEHRPHLPTLQWLCILWIHQNIRSFQGVFLIVQPDTFEGVAEQTKMWKSLWNDFELGKHVYYNTDCATIWLIRYDPFLVYGFQFQELTRRGSQPSSSRWD